MNQKQFNTLSEAAQVLFYIHEHLNRADNALQTLLSAEPARPNEVVSLDEWQAHETEFAEWEAKVEAAKKELSAVIATWNDKVPAWKNLGIPYNVWFRIESPTQGMHRWVAKVSVKVGGNGFSTLLIEEGEVAPSPLPQPKEYDEGPYRDRSIRREDLNDYPWSLDRINTLRKFRLTDA